MIEDRGAFSEITDHGVEKREQEEFLSKRLCFLTCLLMGDPCDEDANYEGHSLAMLNRIAAALNQRVEIRFVPAERRLRSA